MKNIKIRRWKISSQIVKCNGSKVEKQYFGFEYPGFSDKANLKVIKDVNMCFI
jgi:hypothetical protein